MTTLTGRFTTPNGSKYLQQLCKHFSHKIDASYTETEGTCHFDMGPAFLSADENALYVRFELTGPEQAGSARDVIDRHLARFAFSEDFQGMDWASTESHNSGREDAEVTEYSSQGRFF